MNLEIPVVCSGHYTDPVHYSYFGEDYIIIEFFSGVDKIDYAITQVAYCTLKGSPVKV